MCACTAPRSTQRHPAPKTHAQHTTTTKKIGVKTSVEKAAKMIKEVLSYPGPAAQVYNIHIHGHSCVSVYYV